MKILVISLAGVGDTLMATPLLHELRENFPGSIIDILVMWGSSKKILENNPNINKVYQFDMIKEGLFKTIFFCNKLKKEKYDLSINTFPQSKVHYRVISRLIGARLRLSHEYYKNFGGFFLVNHFINPNYNLHCIENNLNFLKILNKKEKLKAHNYEIYFSKKNLKFAEKFIKENKLKDKKIIGFHIGSGSLKNLSLRRWSFENYVELSKKLISLNKEMVVLLFGAKEEEIGNKEIASINPKRIFIVESDDIKDSAALIKKCYIFLSVDTSLMHIASAVGVKNQLVIETPAFNKTVYPYNQKFILIKNLLIKKDILKYYKYDGKPIKASKDEIKKIMKSVRVKQVYGEIKKIINKDN